MPTPRSNSPDRSDSPADGSAQPESISRVILHLDMDAFYASVEERENPDLVGKPLIVGGSRDGRGVVAAANYVVRRFGVHSAMPTATALRLCPDAVVVRPRLDLYAEISRQIREVMFRYTPLVEPLSLDEAFLDVTGSRLLFGSGVQIARRLKAEIKQETSLIASVGVAPNKYLAKIASDLQKPDGLVVVDPQGVQQFLDPLPVGRIWGVGKVTGGVFERLGIATIGDLRRVGLQSLEQQFGRQGEHFWNLARGLDERPVVPDRDAKSVSHETTFPQDISELEPLRAWLLELTEHVTRRMRGHRIKGRTVQLKVRFSDFRTITRAKKLERATDVTADVWTAASELLTLALTARFPPVRLIGVGMSGLTAGERFQQTLFDDKADPKHKQLDAVADAVRDKFGGEALNRGAGLLHGSRHRPLPRPGNDEPRSI